MTTYELWTARARVTSTTDAAEAIRFLANGQRLGLPRTVIVAERDENDRIKTATLHTR